MSPPKKRRSRRPRKSSSPPKSLVSIVVDEEKKQPDTNAPVNEGAGPSTSYPESSSESSSSESSVNSSPSAAASSPSSSSVTSTVIDDPNPNYYQYKALDGHGRYITALKFSSCGYWLASCGEDRLVKVWNAHTGELVRECIGHKNGINDVAWNDESTMLASASDDCTVKIWNTNLDQRKCHQVIRKFRSLKGSEEIVMCCIFKNVTIKRDDIVILASGGHDDCVRLWKIKEDSASPWHVLKGHTYPITSIDFNEDGQLLASSSYDGSVRIWETNSGTWMVSVVKDANKPVSFVKFNPVDDEFIIIGTLDHKIKLWNFIKNKVYITYEGHYNDKYCIVGNFCFGKYIVAGNETNQIYIWSVGGAIVQKLTGHSGIVLCTDVHPFTNVIASAGLDGKENRIILWKSDITSSWSKPYFRLAQKEEEEEEEKD